MAITRAQIEASQEAQHSAGRDGAEQVRLVAGPGTGKSSTIEERVRWLLEQGVPAEAVTVVSFTRAAAFDLRGRIGAFCLANGQPAGADVRVGTLHSLALRTLRLAGALEAYPVDPLVLDEWELSNIFEPEFGESAGVGSIVRRRHIRRDHEALWSTGTHTPPDLIPPDPPISANERARFHAFHGPRTQLYSCVLPGEIIRLCVSRIEAGTLDAANLLGLAHLIVDEFQDLNPMDLRFVNALVSAGVRTFVAGDDDQSLYSFRFASPAGIQGFAYQHPGSGDHSLEACFRCTPVVLSAAQHLIEANAAPSRVEKRLRSLYRDAEPPIAGAIGCAAYGDGRAEAQAIATSCSRLLEVGFDPREILILLSNQRAQGRDLFNALDAAGVAFEPPREASFRDEPQGRVMLSVARITCNAQDYVAHRAILGLLQGVGVGTCNGIGEASIEANLNYRDLFYEPLPDGVFTNRALTALTRAQSACAEAASWAPGDTLAARRDDLRAVIESVLGDSDLTPFSEFCDLLPPGITLDEVRSLLLLDKDEQRANALTDIYRRLGETLPDAAFPPKVRVMSMHGAKGLSARVVFIPGLEEEILPGPRRRPYPGLVLEAARMLYVSITRARLACVLTYADRRFVNGTTQRHAPSRFTANLGQRFERQSEGITLEVARALAAEAAHL